MTALPGFLPHAARARLERSFAACNIVARSGALAGAVVTAQREMRDVRRPWAFKAAVGLFATEAAWVAQRFIRRRTSQDEAAAAIDVATSIVALLAEAIAHGHRHRPGGPRVGIDYAAASLTFASGETVVPLRLAASALAISATYGASVAGSGTAHMNDLAIMTSGIALQPLLAQQRRRADQVDMTRARTLEHTEFLATEHERNLQRRHVHDSILQVFEALAGGWDIDDELLAERIDLEIARLEQVLEGRTAETVNLADGLRQVAADSRFQGLVVAVDIRSMGETGIEAAWANAVCDATREVLTNVRKHSGARQARIDASIGPAFAEVTVTDDGRGFDSSSAVGGFGIRESIHGRMHDIGGVALVESTPGQGTRVTIRVPQ
jgi:signal transduction histidine kinase